MPRGPQAGRPAPRPAAGDAVVEEQPAGLERVVRRPEVGRQVGPPDMLEHADRGDRVELPQAAQIAVVEDPCIDERADAGRPGTGVGLVGLALAQRDADGRRPVALGREAEERAPAAADVQQVRVRTQAQLAGDQVQLRFLRDVEEAGRRQRGRTDREIGARVRQPGVEPERVERLADVVVEPDRGHVPSARVERAAHPRGPLEAPGRRRVAPKLGQPAEDPAHVGRGRRRTSSVSAARTVAITSPSISTSPRRYASANASPLGGSSRWATASGPLITTRDRAPRDRPRPGPASTISSASRSAIARSTMPTMARAIARRRRD